MTSAPTQSSVDLAIGGMTCASCSARVEKKLNKLEGVEASVNLATERAHVVFAAPVAVGDLVKQVEATGYTATVLGSAAVPTEPTNTEPTNTEPTGKAEQVDGPARTPYAGLRDLFEGGTRSRRAIVALVLTVPVVLLAMVPGIGHAFGGARPWIELLLSLPVVTWAAYPFHRAAFVNARHRATTMDTLVSLGVIAAFAWSVVATLAGSTGHMYYEVACVVTAFLLLGRLAEERAKTRGRSALTTLLELGAKDVAVLRDGSERRIPVGELTVGETFVVRPGEKIATDGVVVKGSSAVDAALVTGESVPVDVVPGSSVIGGTINAHGALQVRATRVGAETTLAGITRLVETAQTGKAPVQRLADRVSSIFVPTVLVIALLTFVGWLVTGHAATAALSAAVSVLVVACPCALGLATPTALLAGTGRGAELGVLIKGPQILEDTRRVDTVVLDKTGTVTTGTMKLVSIATAGKLTGTAALQAAASVEQSSEHPIARAVVAAARERGLEIKETSDFRALAGSGARALIKDVEVVVGRASLFESVPDELSAGGSVGTTVYVGWGGTARAALTVADTPRAHVADDVARLTGLGLTPYLLTGDNHATARAVASQVGIPEDNVIAEVMPEDKYDVVTGLQGRGKVVAMVGDGVNDAAALAAADLGLAMGSGTDVAADTADIVLMRPQVGAVADAIGLSRATLSVIKQNLVWAFGYNVLMIPLAVFGRLNPMLAGAAMALSSVMVVVNSLRLTRWGKPAESDGDLAAGGVEGDREDAGRPVRSDEGEVDH